MFNIYAIISFVYRYANENFEYEEVYIVDYKRNSFGFFS